MFFNQFQWKILKNPFIARGCESTLWIQKRSYFLTGSKKKENEKTLVSSLRLFPQIYTEVSRRNGVSFFNPLKRKHTFNVDGDNCLQTPGLESGTRDSLVQSGAANQKSGLDKGMDSVTTMELPVVHTIRICIYRVYSL